MIEHKLFRDVLYSIQDRLRSAPLVHPPRWQSIDVSKLDHMSTHELLHESFTLPLRHQESLDYWRMEIMPNLPWADDHFEKERVSGQPINPGNEWRNWPPGKSFTATHIHQDRFDHSYAERYWPKWAGKTPGGILDGSESVSLNCGIIHPYGDLNDLVTILAKEPLTRQAYLPVWFPEDLEAILAGKRVPCTLGYHFIMRNNELDVVYYIRSCDFVKHFKDDVYLTIRLLLWVLQQCRLANPENDWGRVKPGRLVMHITSMHLFKGDYKKMFK